MAAEIKTRISLDGVEAIQGKLKALGESGERALKQIKAAGGSLTEGGSRSAEQQIKNLGLRTLEHNDATAKLREGLHLLHPLLGSVGVEMGNIRGLTALASVGMGAFAAVVGTAAVAAFYNLGAAAARAKQQIEGLYGTAAPKALTQAHEGARALGRDTGEVAGQMAQLQHIQYLRGPSPEGGGGFTFPERTASGEPWRPEPGSAVEKLFAQNLSNPEGQRFFAENLDKLLRGTGATKEASKTAIDTLLGDWTKQAEAGKPVTLSEESVKAIYNASPEAARRLAGGLGAIGTNGVPSAEQLELATRGGTIWTPEQVAGAVAQLAPQAQKDYATRPRDIGEGVSAIGNAVKDNLEEPAEKFNSTVNSGAGAYFEMLSRGNIPGITPGGHGNETTKNILTGLPTYAPRDIAAETEAVRRAKEAITPTRPPAPALDFVKALNAAHPSDPGKRAAELLDKAASTFAAAVQQFTGARGAAAPNAVGAASSQAPAAAVPQGFPQGRPGSGLVAPTAAAPTATAPSRPTASVVRDPKTGAVKVTQPEAPSGKEGVEGDVGPVGLVGAGAPHPQTATVERDPTTGKVRVIQPGERGSEYELETPPGSDVSGGRLRPYLRPIPDIIGAFPPDKSGGSTYRYDPEKGMEVVPPGRDIEIDPNASFKGGRATEAAEERKRTWRINRNVSPDYFRPDGEPINQSGYLPGFADGGPIVGLGTGTSDSIVMNAGPGDFILKEAAARRAGRRALDQLHAGGVPIRVSNGEEHFTASEVSRIGLDTLQAINGGARVPHFADGGDVDALRREEALDRALGRYRQKWLHYRGAEHSAGDAGAARARIFGGDPGPSAGMENLIPGRGLDLRNVFQYRDGGWVPPKFDMGGDVDESRFAGLFQYRDGGAFPKFDTGGDVDESRFAGLFAPSGVSVPSIDNSAGTIDFGLRNSLSPSVSTPSIKERSSSQDGFGGSPLHLTLSDGRTVKGRISGDELTRALHHESVKQQTTRAGREPYWRGA